MLCVCVEVVQLCDSLLLCLWNSPGRNTRVGSHSLLQGIFLTQGWSLGFPSESESRSVVSDSLQPSESSKPHIRLPCLRFWQQEEALPGHLSLKAGGA